MRFNPRPALRPGDAWAEWRLEADLRGFNPRPALRPGDAVWANINVRHISVSIRARP